MSGKMIDNREAARLIGILHTTLEIWRIHGKGPKYYKIGRTVRYNEKEVKQWIADRQREQTEGIDMTRTLVNSSIGLNMELHKDQGGKLNVALVTSDGNRHVGVFGGKGVERLRLFLDQNFPDRKDLLPQAPEMPGVSKYIEGLGGKKLEIEVANSLGQLVVHVCDGDGKHHIVLNKPEAEGLAFLLMTEYLPQTTKMRGYPAPPSAPNWNDRPGTMCFETADGAKMEVGMAEFDTKVCLLFKPDGEEWYEVSLVEEEVGSLVRQLNHCKHHLRTQVRVHYVKSHVVDTNAETIVVTDLQGTPMAVLRSATELANYLSTNKLTEVAK